MHQPRKGRPSKRSKIEEKGDQELVGDFAKCIIEVLNSDSQTEEEAFEHYVYQLRVRLHKDDQSFRVHFIQGYQVLLEQLGSEKPS